MQGTIAFDGTLSGSIAGGGGGGSEVTITPTLSSGTKIADYTIDGQNDSLYAPDSGSEVTITPNYNAGFKVADYSIDGVAGVLYAPLTVNQGVSPLEVIGNRIRIDLSSYYDKTDCNDTFQKILTPGNHITIDSEDEISATGFPPDYATTEQITNIKWIDGRSIYIKTIHLTGVNFTISQNSFKRANVELHPYIPEAEIGWIVDDASYIFEDLSGTHYYRNFDFWEWEGDSTLTTQNVGLFKRDAASDQEIILTVKYVKGS